MAGQARSTFRYTYRVTENPTHEDNRLRMKIPRLRWIIAGLLFLATAVNYADRQALAVVSDRIRAQFSMTEIRLSATPQALRGAKN